MPAADEALIIAASLQDVHAKLDELRAHAAAAAAPPPPAPRSPPRRLIVACTLQCGAMHEHRSTLPHTAVHTRH